MKPETERKSWRAYRVAVVVVIGGVIADATWHWLETGDLNGWRMIYVPVEMIRPESADGG